MVMPFSDAKAPILSGSVRNLRVCSPWGCSGSFGRTGVSYDRIMLTNLSWDLSYAFPECLPAS